VVFVIPRFGHVDLQVQSATYQGSRPAAAGPSLTPQAPTELRASSAERSRLWAVAADINDGHNEIQR
jgi:hypothetical protein